MYLFSNLMKQQDLAPVRKKLPQVLCEISFVIFCCWLLQQVSISSYHARTRGHTQDYDG